MSKLSNERLLAEAEVALGSPDTIQYAIAASLLVIARNSVTPVQSGGKEE